MDENKKSVTEFLVDESTYGYSLFTDENCGSQDNNCLDSFDKIKAPLIDFDPKSFCITTQVITECDGLVDKNSGENLIGEIVLEYRQETRRVSAVFYPEIGIKKVLCEYEYVIDGKFVKNIPADNIMGICDVFGKFVSYTKKGDINNVVFDKCDGIKKQYLKADTIMEDCKLKAVIDKKQILDILLPIKNCAGKNIVEYGVGDDTCGGVIYKIQFNSCALDGLVNVNIDNESITNTIASSNPELGGGAVNCSNPQNCSDKKTLQAVLTVGCGIEKIAKANGTFMSNSAKIKFALSKKSLDGGESKVNNNATKCIVGNEGGVATLVNNETIRINPEGEIEGFTYTDSKSIIGNGSKLNPLKVQISSPSKDTLQIGNGGLFLQINPNTQGTINQTDKGLELAIDPDFSYFIKKGPNGLRSVPGIKVFGFSAPSTTIPFPPNNGDSKSATLQLGSITPPAPPPSGYKWVAQVNMSFGGGIKTPYGDQYAAMGAKVFVNGSNAISNQEVSDSFDVFFPGSSALGFGGASGVFNINPSTASIITYQVTASASNAPLNNGFTQYSNAIGTLRPAIKLEYLDVSGMMMLVEA